MVHELNISHLKSNLANIILHNDTKSENRENSIVLLNEDNVCNETSLVQKKSELHSNDGDNNNCNKSFSRRNSLRHSSTSSTSSSSSSTEAEIKTFKKKALYAQCLMNGALVILLTGYGMPIGFSGILSPKLKDASSSLKIDDDTSAWIVSVHSIATPIGAILAGPLMEEFGRKKTLQFSIVPMVLGWALISLTPNAIFLILGRLLAGFAVGMGPAPSQILIGEISEPKMRGFFGSTPSASYALGILLVYGMSSIWDWRIVAALGAVFPMIAFVFLMFLPESPTWHINKNEIQKARESLLWLRGGDKEKADQELQSLILLVKLKAKNKNLESPEDEIGIYEKISIRYLTKKYWRVFNKPEVKRPFSIIITFALLQILSGSYIVIFYAVELIQIATGNDEKSIDVVTIAVLTAFTRFVVSILVSMLLFVMGRRTLGIISGIGTSLASFLIVSYLYCKQNEVSVWGCDIHLENITTEASTFTIATLILIYVAMNTLGIFSLPMMLMGETLPVSVRGIISGFTVMLVNIFIFLTTRLYPYSKIVIGASGLFTSFAIISIIIAIFIYLYLPETKDRSLTEIEYYFSTGRNHLWITRDKNLYKRKKKNINGKKLENSNSSSTNLT